jgi:3-oxoacyl-[acyl-carrier-protein] synthase-1
MAAATVEAAAAVAAAAETAAAVPIAPIAPVAITAFSVACAAGLGRDALLSALRSGTSALERNTFGVPVLPTWVGRVGAVDTTPLPPALAAWDSRATRLAWLALEADGFAAAARGAIARHGAARVGLALGTSAATIGVTEEAYRALEGAPGSERFPPALASPRLNTPHAPALFVRDALGLEGPCVTLSTACSSSAKVFAVAERWLRLGLVDAAVVGGVDALCGSLLFGFHALGLVSPEPCRPFDDARRGISIGEGAGFALLERGTGNLMLVGHGEASDAFHMSSPHPGGLGAERALDAALARAGLDAAAIDHVNLHGTASAKNDEVEAALVRRRYGAHTLLAATKGLTGHTMGAAGIVEAAITLLALREGLVPGTAHLQASALLPGLSAAARAARLGTACSHSFGFGGSNAVVVFARA